MILIESHTVEKLEDKQRISDYLPGKLSLIASKKGIKKALIKGLIKLDNRVAKTADYVNGGETIELFRSQHSPKKKLLNLKLKVIFQDEDIAVVVKPAGIAVSGNMLRVLENALPKNLKKTKKSDALDWPLPVHRLDFPTYGLLLCAKTRTGQIGLHQLFEKREISKTYLAICIGKMQPEGQVDTPIKEKDASTKYKVLQTVDSAKFDQLNLVQLNPITGRRHQLRIHMSSLGHPILGDKEYGIEGKIIKGKGLYLAATALHLKHPISQQKLDFNIDPPAKFNKIFPV